MWQQDLEDLLVELFGLMSRKINSRKLTKALEQFSDIDPRGYLLWAADKFGRRMYLSKELYQTGTVQQYKREIEEEIKDLPVMIYGAGQIFEGLTEGNIAAVDAVERMEVMTQPHVLYLLLDSCGFPALKYITAAKKYKDKYPQAMKALPETFKESVEKIDTFKQPRSDPAADPEKPGDL